MVTVDELWCDFSTRIKDTMEKNIPSKTITPHKKPPWFNPSISRICRKKKRAFDRAKKSNSTEDWETFRSLRKELNRQSRRYYRKYVRDTCAVSMKKFCSFIKSLKKDSFGIPSLRGNGELVSENVKKANILNQQFESVFSQESIDLPNIPGPKFARMPDINIDTHGTEQLLTDLDPNKATGPDGVPARILKMGATEIAPALATIFRKSLETGQLPEDWRNANISPIFKKGDRTLPSNYRPVSLTSICCKVMEHVIRSNVMDHLDKLNILTDNQHSFRHNRSCESQLILTTNDFAKSLDKGRQTDAIIMDFSKAFDVVAHRRLLLKLDHYGISGPTHTWISNFLMRRKQRVVIGGDSSDWVRVQSGIPQGTVLGPLLFLIYINDIADQITSTVRLFADDCVLYRTVSKDADADLLQKDLDRLCSWEKKWCM